MDSLPQEPFSVATIAGKKKETRGYTLRVRLSPVEVYSLNQVSASLGLNESATIRRLINEYQEMVKARAITTAFEAKLKADAEFEAILKTKGLKP